MHAKQPTSRGQVFAPLVLFVGVAIGSLYAEGVLRNGLVAVVLALPVVWLLLVRRPPELLPNLLVSLGTVCLVLTVSDFVLRPILRPYLYSTPMNAYMRKMPELPLLGRWEPNVMVEGMAYGDLAAMSGDVSLRDPHPILFKSDERGFRNDSIRGPIQVLLLGDSYPVGALVTQVSVLSALLEQRLKTVVYNLAFPACGPWVQYVNFLIESPTLPLAKAPIVIWLLYTGNDLDDDYRDIWTLEDLPWRSRWGAWSVAYKTFRGHSPLHQILDHGWRRIRHKQQLQETVLHRTLPDGRPVLFLKDQEEWGRRTIAEVKQHPNFPRLRRAMTEMKRATSAANAKLLIAVLPTKGEVYRWILDQREPREDDRRLSGFAEAILETCLELSLPCIEAKSYLVSEALRRRWDTGELLWWRDDTHWNDVGHEVFASLVAPYLVEDQVFKDGREGSSRVVANRVIP